MRYLGPVQRYMCISGFSHTHKLHLSKLKTDLMENLFMDEDIRKSVFTSGQSEKQIFGFHEATHFCILIWFHQCMQHHLKMRVQTLAERMLYCLFQRDKNICAIMEKGVKNACLQCFNKKQHYPGGLCVEQSSFSISFIVFSVSKYTICFLFTPAPASPVHEWLCDTFSAMLVTTKVIFLNDAMLLIWREKTPTYLCTGPQMLLAGDYS